MTTVTAREANQHFARILKQAEAGEEVVITRRGKPVARLTMPPARDKREIDVEKLLAISDQFLKTLDEPFSSADINDVLYDEDGLPT